MKQVQGDTAVRCWQIMCTVALAICVVFATQLPEGAVKYAQRATGVVLVGDILDSDWMGSCFAVSPCIVVTADHVVDAVLDVSQKEPISVKIGENIFECSIVERFTDDDIAVLRSNKKIPHYLDIDFREVKVGEKLFLCGYIERQFVVIPLTVVNNAFFVPFQNGNEMLMVLTSPMGAPGTSGSPILDEDGEVVAVHSGTLGNRLSLETSIVKIYKRMREIMRKR